MILLIGRKLSVCVYVCLCVNQSASLDNLPSGILRWQFFSGKITPAQNPTTFSREISLKASLDMFPSGKILPNAAERRSYVRNSFLKVALKFTQTGCKFNLNTVNKNINVNKNCVHCNMKIGGQRRGQPKFFWEALLLPHPSPYERRCYIHFLTVLILIFDH